VTPFAFAAHSYAEAYSTLTRRAELAPFRFSPEEAWGALESVRAATVLIGLTAAETFDTIRRYAEAGGVGARLCDMLIGQAAVAHNIPLIITWNTGHLQGLFPALSIATPAQFSKR
jgi:hypothetical protein